MPEEPSTSQNKKSKPVKASTEPHEAAEGVELEEVKYESHSDAVTAFLNEVAQLASPYLDAELIGMVTIIAVTPDGNYAQSHEVSKIPESAGDDKTEEARIRRMNMSSRLQTAMELQRHKARLIDRLKDLITQIDG